jgi:hypothetical protein
VQEAEDLVFNAAPGFPSETYLVSVALEVLEPPASTGQKGKRAWTPSGGADEDEDENDTAKRQRLLGYVKTLWSSHGFVPDQAMQTWQTQCIWKDKEATAKALADGEVTTFPAQWPMGRQPTKDPDGASSSSVAAPAAALGGGLEALAMQMRMMQQVMQMTPQTPVAALAAPPRTLAERMTTLHEWRREGLITDEDYATKKQKIIDEL